MTDNKNNSGDRNSGHYNSGHYNSGYYNSGCFNTNEPNARLFNKECGQKMSELDIPCIDLKITEWVSEEKMTEAEKKEYPSYKTTKGYLKTRTYHEAWKLAWSELDAETKQKFLDLPNFDAGIFLEITGIDLTSKSARKTIVRRKDCRN